jgi:arylsulfatase A-like enzyme
MEPEVQYWNVPVMRSRRDGGGFIDELVERPAQQTELTRRATEEAVAFIDRAGDRPFLLYIPYSMPHTPIFRSSAFAGRSRAGRYGDVIEEIDWSVGKIVARLKAKGLAERTLVLFTSDNGPWLTMNQHGGSAGLLRHGHAGARHLLVAGNPRARHGE